MNMMVKVRSLGDITKTMKIEEALKWFSDNGFTFAGRWEDEKRHYAIFVNGINTYQMIYSKRMIYSK